MPREPDGIAWLGNKIITANEGDLFGGSRGFTVFSRNGKPLYDAGESFEYLATRIGHYPEDRAKNKGAEPESVATGRYGHNEFAFVGSERANFVAVYKQRGARKMEFVQVLPTGVAPEGLLPIPERGLFVASTEGDDPVRSQINIFRLKKAEPAYPQIESIVKADGKPIPWGALSALAADKDDANKLYTVHDSFYIQSRIYNVDVSAHPAKITGETVLMKDGATVNYDLEGIAQRSDGSFWLASEGSKNTGQAGLTPNLLIQAATNGAVTREIRLPAAVDAKQKSNGYEGVAVTGVTPKSEAEGNFPVLSKTLAINVLPAMQAGKGWVHDKLEGLARTEDGTVYVVTDNDGVDDSTGETQLLNLGKALED